MTAGRFTDEATIAQLVDVALSVLDAFHGASDDRRSALVPVMSAFSIDMERFGLTPRRANLFGRLARRLDVDVGGANPGALCGE